MEILFFIVLAIIGFIAYRFFTYRREAINQFEAHGGLREAFSDFIRFFTERGFSVTKDTSDTVMLRRDKKSVSSIIQIMVLSKSEVRIIGETKGIREKHVVNDRFNGLGDQVIKAEKIFKKVESNEETNISSAGPGSTHMADTPISPDKPSNTNRKMWKTIIDEESLADKEKYIIETFYIADSVNPIIYNEHSDLIDSSGAFRTVDDSHTNVTPSFRNYANRAGLVPEFIPSWFMAGYPDVAMWFSTEDGMNTLEGIVDDFGGFEQLTNIDTRKRFLREAIDSYITQTGKDLETTSLVESD